MRNFVSSLRNRFNLRCQNLIIWLGVEIPSYRFKFSIADNVVLIPVIDNVFSFMIF